MAFETLDYLIFFATLFISAGIGVFYRFTGGRQKTNEEYLLGNRKQNPAWVALSLMASFMSAVSILGGSAEAYVYGTHFFLINIGYSLGILASVILFIPTFYELKNISVYQYLEMRFGTATRLIASLASTIQMVLYMSIALVAPAIALQTVTNLSRETSVLVSGLACICYAGLGGMKAIIITDVFQSLLMYASMLAVIFSGYIHFGSFSEIINIAAKHGRIDFSNFSMDLTVRHTWLSTLIGGFVNSIILNGINQTQVQRYLTMKNYKNVSIAALSSAPLITALSLSICLSGLTVFAKYAECDPIKTNQVSSGDHLLAFYVLNTFRGSGLSGLLVAGIFSASLSTVSPLLNSLAAVTLEDYFKPLLKKSADLKTETTKSSYFTQIFTWLYGVACLVIALLALRITSLLQASITVFNFVGGPMLGIFTLGMFTTTANQKGSILGFLIGMTFVAILSVVPKPVAQALSTSTESCSSSFNQTIFSATPSSTPMAKYEYGPVVTYITRISYMYYGMVGFLITFVIGYVTSLCVGNDSRKKINANLLYKSVARPLLKKHSSLICLENLEAT